MILETPRLQLIPMGDTDWQILANILRDPFVRQYLCDNRIMEDSEIDTMTIANRQSFQEKGYGLWFILEKSSQELSGFVGLWNFFEEGQPQLLYALLPQHTGKGLATEASQRIVDFSFDDLDFNYLTASCDRPNLASQKLLERLHFQKIKEEEKNGMPLVFYRLDRKK